MYSKLPNLVIGFHGCDKTVAEKVLRNSEDMRESKNEYDWLGHGIYFWEQNLERAWEWAEQQADKPKSNIKNPSVIGAVIDLGNCLNLCDMHHIKVVRNQYYYYKIARRLANLPLPENKNTAGNSDLLLRSLDCAVIESLHRTLRKRNQPEYDSVRGVFLEGEPIYPNAGFRNKTHIQICVRNPNCIKGLFAPRGIDSQWTVP
jgi:hypothetical protein